MKLLTIGQAAKSTGVTAKTIRYYEDVGILPAARRTKSGYRHYDEPDIERLRFIRRARSLGLPLRRLKMLTNTLNGTTPRAVRPRLLALVQEHISSVSQQIAELEILRQQLEDVSRRIRTSRRGPVAGPCRCLTSRDGTS
ncbi:MAG TPA: MerR family transcriptional regulator [Gemmatimonadaceae bacterium]|jgi:DNA-binding transcriptional MerR regulator